MKGCTGIILVFVLFLAVNLMIGGYATEYVVNFWTPRITGHPAHLPFSAALVIGLFGGEITIPVAVVTWGLSFVL